MGRGIGPGSEGVGCCYVCVSLDSLCRCQVLVSVHCAWRIPAHCGGTCICLWQILHIQICLCVGVGPGIGSTSPAFMRSSASQPADPHEQLAQKW